jgi:hypothetical protein
MAHIRFFPYIFPPCHHLIFYSPSKYISPILPTKQFTRSFCDKSRSVPVGPGQSQMGPGRSWPVLDPRKKIKRNCKAYINFLFSHGSLGPIPVPGPAFFQGLVNAKMKKTWL